jgi:hypothetical protein
MILDNEHDDVVEGEVHHLILMIKAWLHFAVDDEGVKLWRAFWAELRLTFYDG